MVFTCFKNRGVYDVDHKFSRSVLTKSTMKNPSLQEFFNYYFDLQNLRPRKQFPYEFATLKQVVNSMPPEELAESINHLFEISRNSKDFQRAQDSFTSQMGYLMELLSHINNQAQIDRRKTNEEQNISIVQFQKRLGRTDMLTPEMVRGYYLYCIFNPHGQQRINEERVLELRRASPLNESSTPESLLLDLPYYGPEKTQNLAGAFDLSNTTVLISEKLRISGYEHYFPLDPVPDNGVFVIEIAETSAPIWTAVQYHKKLNGEFKRVTEVFQWTCKIVQQKFDERPRLKFVAKTIEEKQFLSVRVHYRKRLRGEKA